MFCDVTTNLDSCPFLVATLTVPCKETPQVSVIRVARTSEVPLFGSAYAFAKLLSFHLLSN